MKNYTYKFYKTAELDILESKIWYKNQKIGLEVIFSESIKNCINQILKNPKLFQIKYKKVRIAYIKKFPFGVH